VAAVLGCVMSAAAPLTIVAGLVSTAYAVTGNPGLPVAFAVIGLVLGVFSAGYVAMSRHLPHSGAFYAYVSHGLGRSAGVSAAWVSLTSYNLLQVALYGLIGAAATPLIRQTTGLEVAWWIPALAAWALVGALGVARVELNGRVLGTLLLAELAVIAMYDAAWLTHPAYGLDWSLLVSPARLAGPGVGAVLAIAVLGFAGFETGASYTEEARARTVPVATYLGVGVIGLVYGVSSWAMAAATGTGQITEAARAAGPDLVFTLAAARLGDGAAAAGRVLLVTSLLAAMISFHATTARYTFALGRERVLPGVFERTTHRGAPKAASIAQTLLALTVILLWALAGWDPVLTLFYLAGTSGALGILILLLATGLAVAGFFAPDQRGETLWAARVAPLVSLTVLGLILALVIGNFAVLLGVVESSPLRWGIPAAYLAIATTGYGYGRILKAARPDVYAAVGRGARAVLPPPATGLRAPCTLKPNGPLHPGGPLQPGGPLLPPGEQGWTGPGWPGVEGGR
jgi:amino acid transporter